MDNLSLESVYARKCEARRISKAEAVPFLNANHRMGYCGCRYRYGLFYDGRLVAVASFSQARNILTQAGTKRSYEWIRYASASGIRVLGGMGKLLNAFVEEVHPDDVMTYVDTAWSDGAAYKELGFKEEGLVSKPSFTCIKFRKTLSY